jgi:UDP-N-acetylmuramate: L-alanyl-gamma-D-glutamyl-meso-diaminopimelate ligase
MHLHVLGVCGTFMAGVALLAREAGHRVSGSDMAVYPPMSTQLERAGLEVIQGYEAAQLDLSPDVLVVGNVMRRGMPVVEALLDRGLPYTSGPQWLAEQVLASRWVVAVAGTHGKTTTASMVAWILEYAGLQPGFLIGGVPANFGVSARLGAGAHFVVEADEYDTAFFDKRSKFVHYRPRTLVLNNLEYDHADIFPDLAAISTQFHHLVRTVPGRGLIVVNTHDVNLQAVLERGCWTPLERFGAGDWEFRDLSATGERFQIWHCGRLQGEVHWQLFGEHNVSNALAAVAAARHAGVPPAVAVEALASFLSVRRRLESRGRANGVEVVDDFAHHPTAITATLAALRPRIAAGRLIAVLEPRSNTMRMGVHRDTLLPSLSAADRVFLYLPDKHQCALELPANGDWLSVVSDVEAIVAAVCDEAQPGDLVVVMSNGGFAGIHQKLLDALQRAAGERLIS